MVNEASEPSLILCSIALSAVRAQSPLSRGEALAGLYRQFDQTKGTAQWICTSEQAQGNDGWQCSEENATVYVSMLLLTEIQEGDTKKVYLVASAEPPEFKCHACRPAIGVAVFVWQSGAWALLSANTEVVFEGGWGWPPEVGLVSVGPERHGVMLENSNVALGFSSSYSRLLLPLGSSVLQAWVLKDEQDDYGAYDPTDNFIHLVRYRSSAAFKFVPRDDKDGERSDYYDIEVISRGEVQQDSRHPLKREDWSEIYRFSGTKYQLLKHTDFLETKKPGKQH